MAGRSDKHFIGRRRCSVMPYCTDCGYEVPPGTRFCPSCGSDQMTVPAYEARGSPSALPLAMGILGIILGIIVPLLGIILGALGAALAHTDKNKKDNTYLGVCILAVIVSLAVWALNFIFLMSLLAI
ncbi:MAG: zinc ribbon domain-containing protein [Gammaproteobacteria bacterium]|nr:zinc ribbon domain-containing protein [Gammaproteobacteria bacterium]